MTKNVIKILSNGSGNINPWIFKEFIHCTIKPYGHP